jgi:hypothetical protein
MIVRTLTVLATLAVVAACQGESKQDAAQAGTDHADVAVDMAAGDRPPAAAVKGTFEPVPVAPVAGTRRAPCSIDVINGEPAAGRTVDVVGPELKVGGWIAAPNLKVPANFALLLSGEQTYRMAGRTGFARPDVARALRANGLAHAGFNARGNLEQVAPGTYEVSLVQEFEGRTVRCDNGARVTIARE